MSIIKKILRVIKFTFPAKPLEVVKEPKLFTSNRRCLDVCTIKNSRICCKVCFERLECKYKCESFDEVCDKNVCF